jgi:cysteine-S-conjugate beta-lyase
MPFDFDTLPNRRNTHSYKWDQSKSLFGQPDILPLWVADMDFEGPPAIKKAIKQRAAQGIYGYTIRPESYVQSIIGWFERRHRWSIQSEWLSYVPGIVPALSLSVELFSEPGSSVILQSPVYYPFYEVIRMNGRVPAVSPLTEVDGKFVMNYEHLEQLMQQGAKLMLLCSPHNPGGRVWTREELQKLGQLCLQYGVTVVSDEIHCDLTLFGNKHVPFASISDEFAQASITCLAPSKTFNLPGLQAAFTVIPDPKKRKAFDYRIKALSLHMMHYFTPDAVTAAYNEGEPWLEALLEYIQGNVEFAIDYLQRELPEARPMRPEGTYLLWVDCRGLGLDIPGLKDLMYHKAKVAFNEGSVFGKEGEGFLRINLACPRSVVQQALEQFAAAYRKLKK